MSAREIIAKIDALPPEEKAVLIEWARKYKISDDYSSGVNPKVVESSENIFTQHDQLFAKLAE